MTKQTSNKFSPEVRERAVRMVFDHQTEHGSQWATIMSIASKIGCTPETLRSWVRQAERDEGKRAGLTTDERERIKTLDDRGHPSAWAMAVARSRRVRHAGMGGLVQQPPTAGADRQHSASRSGSELLRDP